MLYRRTAGPRLGCWLTAIGFNTKHCGNYVFVCGMQMYSMPVFDMIEAAFRAWGWTRNKIITRLLMRTLYVAFTCFVAVTLPFFGGNDLAPGVMALYVTTLGDYV